MYKFANGERVKVLDAYELSELQGKIGIVEPIPGEVAKTLAAGVKADREISEFFWVVFKPEGSVLEVGEIDAALFHQNDLVRVP